MEALQGNEQTENIGVNDVFTRLMTHLTGPNAIACLADVEKLVAKWDQEAAKPAPKPRSQKKAVTKLEEHIIDCDAPPFIPDGKQVRTEDQIASRVTGSVVWDQTRMRLHLDPGQQDRAIKGAELKTRLEGQPVFPAQVLDFLMMHSKLIPESWKWEYVHFWGTIYRRAGDGSLCVRGLCWDGKFWRWAYDDLETGFDSRDLAVVLTS